MKPFSAAMLGGGLLAASLLTLPAAAATIAYHGDMAGGSEVPPTTSTGTGTVAATLDTDTGKLDYTVTWSGLTGPASMAHIHGPAPVGANAPPIVDLGMSPASPIKGTTTLTPAQVKDLASGRYYINVHSAKFPKGEIRAQLIPAG